MTNVFVTSAGATIKICRELGKGGEGSVYEVSANHLVVAKLYNQYYTPDVPKQAKLRFMATTADKDLLSYAAWPQETLHKTRNGPVVGFLMPNVSGRVPIHKLYSPAHRRQEYPQAAWDFLLFVARNTAAAFAAIHHHGHVLGDVNQDNVLVGADSKVMLIDTDSFQINADGTLHLCKVGVAHFTPPELQGPQSFDRFPRTSNHDNFGLALLIFHLLFGGRHPYSGVPLRTDVGEALEKDIQAYRYAYALDGQRRGFNPPPSSIPITIVPDPIQSMFTYAFTEHGTKGGRPTAQNWVTALDSLRRQLKRCATSPIHVYPGHLGRCPWCALEDHGVIYFLDMCLGAAPAGSTGFDLARIWAAIEIIPAPPVFTIPNITTFAVTPTPLPPSLNKEGIKNFLRIIIIGVAVWLITVSPNAWVFVLVGAWWAWTAGGDLGRDERKAERTKRQAVRDVAQQSYDQIIAQVRQEISPEVFSKKKQELANLRDEYHRLPEREKAEISNLHATAAARQKYQFLGRHFIDAASISGIGPSKKAALRSFGIETAADVTWYKVIAVKGFGEVLTRAMVDWQKACERQFVFNPDLAVTEADKNAVRAKLSIRKRTLELTLNAGASELQRLRNNMINKATELNPMLQVASQKLAQAQGDLNVQGGRW
jgi:DNA-binding helix-hairpin-helix protein with protein kinase domain